MSRAWRTIDARWPHVGRRLREAEPCTEIELDSAGPVPTLRAFGRRLASAWDPEAEAQLQCAHLPDACASVTVFGIGMGHLPQSALKRLSEAGALEVVVLNVGLLKVLLDVLEEWTWLDHPAVTLRLPEERSTLPAHWAVTTPLLQCVEPAAERLRDRLVQALGADHVRAQQHGYDALIERNLAGNVPALERDEDVATLFVPEPIPGSAAVVAGAGPSLGDSIERVRELQRIGASLVVVDAAFIPLMQAGIVPDYVVSLDPKEAVLPFYEIDLEAARDTTLVYFPSVHPRVVRHWPHRRCYAYTRHRRFDEARERFPAASLFASGSVIHPATDLAVRLGAASVYLAGADFGFPGALTHVDGARCAEPLDRRSARDDSSVRNYRGEKVSSLASFVSYYRDLEAYIGSPVAARRRFISLSEDSARLHGVQVEARAA